MRGSRRFVSSVLGLVLAVGATLAAPVSPAISEDSAATSPTADDRVPGAYLVDLKPGVDANRYAAKLATRYGGRATFVYDSVVGGFAFEGSAAAARRLARDERVEFLEQDRVARIADAVRPGVNHLSRDKVYEAFDAGYKGNGVTIAIVDTGIDGGHPFFSHSNVVPGHSCVPGSENDRNGHGTATASNAVGRVGVAHEANALPVRVFPGSGATTTWARVVCGLKWIHDHASEVDVVNISIAGTGTRALKKAVKRLIDDGLVVVAAAGNTGGRTQAPARYAGVIAVSALAGGNKMAKFSASGGDMTAPGVSIFGADKNGTTSNRSGTSRSSPQVAGAAAIILAEEPAFSVLDTLRISGTCPNGSQNGTTGMCPGRWKGDDRNAEPLVNAYCAGRHADITGSDVTNCPGS